MRVTKDTLLKIAQDFVTQRLRTDRSILGIFLQGSLLEDEPLLGGITDIDLFIVHSEAPAQQREVVRVSDEIHLDIAHHARSLYRKPRELRQHTWLGDCINGGKILYDPQHFLDFTQASVRGQFDRTDQVLMRSRARLSHARQIWVALHEHPPAAQGAEVLVNYFKAVEHAANSVAGLSGAPLTERRFLTQFPTRAANIQRPGLAAGLLGLLGAPQVEVEQVRGWLEAWKVDFQSAATEFVPVRLHPYRLWYYVRGIEALLDSGQPKDALWPLLRTWSTLASLQPNAEVGMDGWRRSVQNLGLWGDGWVARLEALDAFIDTVDELLENWANEHGA